MKNKKGNWRVVCRSCGSRLFNPEPLEGCPDCGAANIFVDENEEEEKAEAEPRKEPER